MTLIHTLFKENPIKDIMEVVNLLHLGNRSELRHWLKENHNTAHLQSSVFKLSKDLIDSIHEEGIVAYTS